MVVEIPLIRLQSDETMAKLQAGIMPMSGRGQLQHSPYVVELVVEHLNDEALDVMIGVRRDQLADQHMQYSCQ
jgi:hypothetical protein